MQFTTLAVHSALGTKDQTLSASPAVERAASWIFESMADLDAIFEGADGFHYGREKQPTPVLLEQALTALEGGRHTLTFASGMAAIAAVLAVAGAGSKILATSDLYGKTYLLLQDWLPASGADIRFVASHDKAGLQEAFEQWQPDLLVTETISNPLVKVSDLPWLIAQADAVGCKVLVDNTFASPFLCRPAEMGADYTVESLTKYINGHGDVVGGSVTLRGNADYDMLSAYRSSFGAILDPQAAWLTLRGLRTLGLRQERQCANALKLASFLQAHPAVANVYYPGLPSDPNHNLATELFRQDVFGGMLAFDVKPATRERAWQVMDRFQLAFRAPTLGDYATLIAYPAHASHRGLSPEQRAEIGVGDGLIRVSTGIEDIEDIIADFEQALAIL